MEIHFGAHTRQEETGKHGLGSMDWEAWIGKGCSARCRAAGSSGYPSSISTALPLPPSLRYLQVLQQSNHLDFPRFPEFPGWKLSAWSRLLFAHQSW